ncbi:hypothetical protein [Nocardioides ochotonae]|uniref:hypothetical protein n=1 Tax=Nocardioides ochotonae TaxID=2685869 RepID=UPI0014082B50|nr:hypothetical protein [Nocardioides ochotonae]
MRPEDDVVPDESVPTWAVRLEAKVDVALARHGSQLDAHERDIADLRAAAHEHDARLRALERVPAITPRQLGAAALGVVGAVGALVPFLDRVYT